MLRYCVKTTDALKDLRTDKDGVVSFEYVTMAACVLAIAGTVFDAGLRGLVKDALVNALNTIGTAVNTAVGG